MQMAQLRKEWMGLQESWRTRDRAHGHNLEFIEFCRATEEAQTWMALPEAFLSSTDVGKSVDDVDSLLKQFSDFEKSLKAWQVKTQALEDLAVQVRSYT